MSLVFFQLLKMYLWLQEFLVLWKKRKKSLQILLKELDWSRFNLDTDETVINAVAIADTGDPRLVNIDEETFDKKIQIFEEYAAAGVEILYKKVMEDPKKALNLIYRVYYVYGSRNYCKGKKLEGYSGFINILKRRKYSAFLYF